MVDLDVETLMGGHDGRREAPARKEAERFIKRLLKKGPLHVKAIEHQARAAGLP